MRERESLRRKKLAASLKMMSCSRLLSTVNGWLNLHGKKVEIKAQ